MHTDVAREAFEWLGQADDFLRFFLILEALFKRRFVLERARQCPRVGRVMRDEFGQPIAVGIRHVQNPTDVAHHRFRTKSTKGRNLRDRCHAVSLLHVVNHLVAPVLAKVNIKVRHGDALRVQKSLEQQRILERIKVGNQQRIRHQRACARTTARSDRNIVVFGPLNEIGHDEKVPRETHFDNGVQLNVQTLDVAWGLLETHSLIGIEFAQTRIQSLMRDDAQIFIE